MLETLSELFAYLKNPIAEADENTNLHYRFKKFLHLLMICILTGALLTPLFVAIESLGWVDMKQHAMEKIMETYPKYVIFILAVVIAPVFEELFFRAPLTLFKNLTNFKWVFYIFAALFGLVHISNYEITTNVLLLTPILIAPQTILGGYLGFVRVRFGLQWSMLLHAFYNAFFMFITFAGDTV